MMRRSPRLHDGTVYVIAGIVLFASALLSAASAIAAAQNTAEVFVQQNVDKGYAILNNAALSEDQRRAQFRDLMLSITDMHRIGLFALGFYAKGASTAQLNAFETAFTDYAVAVYESRLSLYKGQTLRVAGSIRRAADDVIVNADLVNPRQPNAPSFKAAFRVRKTADGRPIITDMEVEGIWLALSERADFAGFLDQHGGTVAALTDHLRALVRQIRAGGTAP
jgi:phospholipid transport system substrate-binding protein